MPTITRLFIKTALLYLLCALALGTASAWTGGGWDAVAIVQFHLLAVGWLTQMVFGVGYWLFPIRAPSRGAPPSSGADRSHRLPDRGPQWPLALAYALLNIGLIARAVVEPLFGSGNLPRAGWLLAASGAVQLAAAILFVWQVWPRIRARTP